jgi:Putative transposase of IS4/5 family (DUF4096)
VRYRYRSKPGLDGPAYHDRDTTVGPRSVVKLYVPDKLWMIIGPLLPLEPPKPNGGRPRVPERAALAGIIYVLKSGIPWGCSRRDFRLR